MIRSGRTRILSHSMSHIGMETSRYRAVMDPGRMFKRRGELRQKMLIFYDFHLVISLCL